MEEILGKSWTVETTKLDGGIGTGSYQSLCPATYQDSKNTRGDPVA
jgi:hypothetical protein